MHCISMVCEKGVLGLSQKAYLEKILKKYSMHASNPTPAPIVKGDRFGNFQCPRNQYEIDQMKAVPYASAVGSLMYAQVCTRPDLAFFTRVLGRFQSNPGLLQESRQYAIVKQGVYEQRPSGNGLNENEKTTTER